MPRNADAKARMARKLRSKKGSAIYTQRKAIVKPVNGQIKEASALLGFLLRGLEKVDAEWRVIGAGHNLLKLYRHRRSQKQLLAMATRSRAKALAAAARAKSATNARRAKDKTESRAAQLATGVRFAVSAAALSEANS